MDFGFEGSRSLVVVAALAHPADFSESPLVECRCDQGGLSVPFGEAFGSSDCSSLASDPPIHEGLCPFSVSPYCQNPT